jgi:sulfide:quinone oxidoreductase
MARVLILGGGFAAITAAQELTFRLGLDDEIIVVSKSPELTFYPAIIPCIFGDLNFADIRFDLASALSAHGVRFIHGGVDAINTTARKVTVSGDRMTYSIEYDYLIFAVGRRIETGAIPGLAEYSHQLFTIDQAQEFKEAISEFKSGSIVVGLCGGASLPVPVCESALALADAFASQIKSGDVRIKALFPASVEKAFAGANLFRNIEEDFRKKGVDLITDFEVETVEANRIISRDGSVVDHDLLMLIPPFAGQLSLRSNGHVTDISGFANVNAMMQVSSVNNVYAAGDITAYPGPKFGYMAMRQGKVAAENIASQIAGDEPAANYEHRIEWAIGELYTGPVFFHYGFWDETLDDFDNDAMFGMARKIRQLYGPIKGLETAGVSFAA